MLCNPSIKLFLGLKMSISVDLVNVFEPDELDMVARCGLRLNWSER